MRPSVIVLIAVLYASSVRAELSCHDMFAISRLFDASVADDIPNTQLRSLAQDIADIQFKTTTRSERSVDFRSFGPISEIVLLLTQDLRRGDTAAMTQRLQQQRSTFAFASALNTLVSQGCEPVAGRKSDTAGRAGENLDPEDGEGGAEAVIAEVSTAAASFIGLIVALVLAVIFQFYKIWRTRRRRRQRRYPCNIDAEITLNETDWPVTMLDINCYGTKLRKTIECAAEPGDEVLLTIAADTHRANVAWTNSHFIGVSFQNRMLVDQVQELVGKKLNIKDQNEKTAPQGAVHSRSS